MLLVKTPMSEADALRALACEALDGLVRCPKIRQIMQKMPLCADNQLHCALP